MEKIIGRQEEIVLFNRYKNSSEAKFIAIYGRRRVGKTFIVNQFFRSSMTFAMTGVMDGNFDMQITAFMDACADFQLDIKQRPKTWMDAFIALKNALKSSKNNQKIVIFIDELPCFDTQRSNFVNALGYFWNTWASLQSGLLLIVCGSATSWMIRNIVDNKGGLHNRITDEIHLKPFTLAETEQLLISRGFLWNREMILQAYMMLGGIPYYLDMLLPDESLPQNIDRLFFSQDSRLKREFSRLYSTLFNSPEKYKEIISALSTNRGGVTRDEIMKKSGINSSGSLSEKLNDLINCDIIRKYKIRSRKLKSNSSLYQLTDMFSIFYLTFINKAEVEDNYWQRHIGTPEINTWLGLAFEKVCLLHIQQIKKCLKIDGISTVNYAWRSNNPENRAQVDLIIDRADNIINLCEIKYSDEEYSLSKSEDEKIRNRVSVFRSETSTKKAIWTTLITTFGLKQGLYTGNIVQSVTLDALFE